MMIFITYSVFCYIFYAGMLYEECEAEESFPQMDLYGILLLITAPVSLPFVVGYNYSKTLKK